MKLAYLNLYNLSRFKINVTSKISKNFVSKGFYRILSTGYSKNVYRNFVRVITKWNDSSCPIELKFCIYNFLLIWKNIGGCVLNFFESWKIRTTLWYILQNALIFHKQRKCNTYKVLVNDEIVSVNSSTQEAIFSLTNAPKPPYICSFFYLSKKTSYFCV